MSGAKGAHRGDGRSDGERPSGADTTGGGFYDETLLYDVLHAPDTRREVLALRTIAREHAPRSRSGAGVWLEPACGTGRHGRMLAKMEGVRSVGFDLSEAMVRDATARARRAGVGDLARFVVADMTSFAERMPPRVAGRVSFAFNLINSVRHLMSDRAMRKHLDQMRMVLKPGGVYAVGIHTAAYGVEVPTRDDFEAARGGLRVTQRVRYLPASGPRDRVERVISTIEATTPGGGGETRVSKSSYGLRAYAPREWTGVIRRAGWGVRAVLEEDGSVIETDRWGRPAAGAYAVWVLGPGV